MTKKQFSSEIFDGVKQKIQTDYKSDKLFQQFATIYIDSVSPKLIEDGTIESNLLFFQDRYKQFIKTIESKSQKYIEIKPIQSKKISHEYSLELVCLDAQYLIITLESVFKLRNIRVTKMVHPLFATYFNKNNKCILISHPKEKTQLISASYILFECLNESVDIDDLLKDIKHKIDAIRFVTADYNQIIKNLTIVQKEVSKHPTPRKEFHEEWIELMDWLTDDNFSFFGYIEMVIDKQKNQVEVKQGSGLGVLSDQFNTAFKKECVAVMQKQSIAMIDYRSPFVFDRISAKSIVKRFDNLMRLSLKIPINDNRMIEYNFLGLLRKSSLLAKNLKTPIIKLKIFKIFENKNFWKGSHNYNQTIRFFNTTPKFELFRSPTENLQEIIEHLMSISDMSQLYIFTRKRIDTSKLFLMVVFPTDQFSPYVIQETLNFLREEVSENIFEYFSINGDQFGRIHVYFDMPDRLNWYPNIKELEKGLRQLIRPWEDALKEALQEEYRPENAEKLYEKYVHAFPKHHKVRRTGKQTLADICFFEKVFQTGSIQFNLIPFIYDESILSGKACVLLIYHKEKIDLIHFMPIFQHLKLHIFDEITTRVGSKENLYGYIHAFRVAGDDETLINATEYCEILADLLKAVFDGKCPNDPLNGLLVKGKMNWQQIFTIQVYRNYLLQLRPPFTKIIIDETLLKHFECTTLFATYFYEKFDINLKISMKVRLRKIEHISQKIEQYIKNVADINEDFILRWVFNLLQNTVRTNFFKQNLNESQLVSLKFDCKHIQIPAPKPFKEIFVFDPEVEGVHIRFGPVSRGGIRWSNRLKDYRNEVIGLAHTQKVKNVVIVPNGSKGGFVIKKPFLSKNSGKESKKQYEKFMTGLLDVTDNLKIDGSADKPNHVLCYDEKDAYLVVAADKGTAMFSDYANQISINNKFWLGDAYASGGSDGYNHKEYGITAKGAWECVKLHFREKGKNIDVEPFSVVGVGDMSGDVFGNGMLLSKAIQLKAAFNHCHIFLDPNPDPEISWKERARLFKKDKSTWRDYDRSLISYGGGVFDRNEKEIHLNKQVKQMLGIKQDKCNGEQLIHAILKMECDLLWFGGIGTYIKSVDQTNLSVRDPANDAVRVSHNDVKARVIGEGANLAVTQEARQLLSEEGTQINTDFIDNSAGVNMSDYEVNLKIFLMPLVRTKKIKSQRSRSDLLKKVASDIVKKVLVNNQDQHMLLSVEEKRSIEKFSSFINLINQWVFDGILNSKVDAIPSQVKFDLIHTQNKPLSRPLLALLQSHMKIKVYEELIESQLVLNPHLNTEYEKYFPLSLTKAFPNHAKNHPLKREILAMLITNKMVNYGGILFFPQIQEATAASIRDIARIYLILLELFGLDKVKTKLLNAKNNLTHVYEGLMIFEKNIMAVVVDFLLLPDHILQFEDLHILKEIVKLKRKTLSTLYAETKDNLEKKLLDVHKDILTEVAMVSLNQNIADIFYLYKGVKTKMTLSECLIVFSEVDNYFSFCQIVHSINQLKPQNKWEVEQQMTMLKIIQQKKFVIYKNIAKKSDKTSINEAAIQHILDKIVGEKIKEYRITLDTLMTTNDYTMMSCSVLVNKLDLII